MGRTQRRGYGEGSVFFNQKRERWVAMVDLGRNDLGRRQRVWRSSRTKTEATAALRDLQRAVERGDDPRGVRRTVADAVDDFTAHGIADDLAASTRYKTQLYADALKAALGDMRLRDLNVRQVERWLASLAEDGKARDTISVARRSATQTLDHAIRLGWMPPERNVARLARLPQTKAGRPSTALAEETIAALLKVAADEWWAPLLVTVAATGIRIGEAAGLAWSAFDATARTISIDRTVRLNPDGSLTMASPKAGSGRCLAIPAELAETLKVHRRKMGEHFLSRGEPTPDLAFPTRTGSAPDPNDLRRWLRKIARTAGVPGVTGFHVFRHSVASSLADAGVAPVHVAAQLGHSTPRTTLGHYTHQLRPVADAAVERGNRLLGG